MRILYLVGGSKILFGEATRRDAAFVTGMRSAGQQVDAVSLSTPVYVDGLRDKHLFHTPGANNTLVTRVRHLSTVITNMRRKPQLETATLTRLNLHRYSEETLELLADSEENTRNKFPGFFDYIKDRKGSYDTVIIASVFLSGFINPIRKILDCQVVCLAQGYSMILESLDEPYRSETRKLLRKRARHLDQVVATSRFLAMRAQEFLSLPAARIRVALPGLDLDDKFVPPAVRQRQPFTAGFLSPIREDTGLDLVVEALEPMARADPSRCYLAIAGPVEDEAYWKMVVKRLDKSPLKGHYQARGQLGRFDRLEFLSSLSVLILPNREPQINGLAIIEAMLLGVPVVAPSLGILPEIFQHIDGGLMISSDSPVWMYSQALELFANMPETADNLGKNAREGAERLFSPTAAGERLLKCLGSSPSSSTRI
ncbi:MAG: glycosyltransferase family 4 protein [Planctomycetota bacterium]|jgi:glycosyltransferase involved in cell wall biosynthesis|nr:glycosyltransferase family 4 protein [Planctomycetota bacterium]